MKFTFPMKCVSKFKPKTHKSGFAWSLNENKYLNLEEVRKLRRYCIEEKRNALKSNKSIGIRNWFMVELGLNAGLRVKEMTNLKCSDLLIDKDQSSIIATGKREKKRAVWISSGFKRECIWFLKWKQRTGKSIDPESYVLSASNGRQLTRRTLQKSFKNCIDKAGLPAHFSIHCLRHTFGSHLYLASNHNLRLVQEQLGHSSVRITEVYASLMDFDAKEAVGKLYK